MSGVKSDYALDRSRLLRLVAVAMVVGAVATLAALLLVQLIRLCTNLFFYQHWSFAESSPALNTLGAWVIVLPVIGGVLVGLMARYGSDKIRGHGIPEAMEIILFGKSRMSARVAVLKPLSSGIVIGSGGPFGAEGPIIMTGGALGSLLAQYLNLSAAERKTLLVSGACAGMTAIFGTPVAALLLAVEMLLFELRPRSLLPVAMACAVAGFLRPFIFEAGPLFPLAVAPVTASALVSGIVAGICSGVLAVIVTLALYRTEDAFAKLPVHWMWWPAIGGVVVGIGGYFEPRAFGIGYDVIGDLLNNRLAVAAVVSLLAVKAVMWVAALGSGTSGGVLAPLLMIGAGLGVVLSPWLPGGSAGLWALVCMAAVLGSVLGAPLTAIVFAIGLTHATNALLPLLLTVAVAWGVTTLVLRRSIMTEKIARRGLHIYREYAVDPLERMHVDDLMSRSVISVDAAMTIRQARATVDAQQHRRLPVVSNGRLRGMLESGILNDHRHDENLQVADLLAGQHQWVLSTESARAAAARMIDLKVSSVPVVADADGLQLVGVLAMSDLLRPVGASWQEETLLERLR
ncbi:chloride channel protein [Jeongeupia sp. HS-3]|uniref:chloride channel protein n=1 Tax=Jeongeupia sp. HS-3 TaxID=1009682 RepID=UPI0018A3A1EC|nr:chloride channel protein [Jeongeupia sp. HS-3]BCL75864.1 chloride channel protein [Jeongeupia sp. HS-3]